jgi:septal ring factor EnvC (AmiA/AmiB activator)
MARRYLAAATVAVAASASLAPTAAADRIADKRAEATRVERQIREFDMRLEATINAYNEAAWHLREARHQIADNKRRLAMARDNLRISQTRLAAMVLDSYKDGEGNAVLKILASG